MLNISTLNPCPACGRNVPMLNPAKGDAWYLQCAQCHYSTETNEDVDAVRTQWDNDEAAESAERPTKLKKKEKKAAAPKTKGTASNAALVREQIAAGTTDFDALVTWAEANCTFANVGAARSCVKANLKKLGAG